MWFSRLRHRADVTGQKWSCANTSRETTPSSEMNTNGLSRNLPKILAAPDGDEIYR
jgi:hypothetical protein